MKLTRKQKRILIANAIQFTVIAIGVAGMLVMLSSVGMIQNEDIPLNRGIVQFIIGSAIEALAIYSGIKIYT